MLLYVLCFVIGLAGSGLGECRVSFLHVLCYPYALSKQLYLQSSSTLLFVTLYYFDVCKFHTLCYHNPVVNCVGDVDMLLTYLMLYIFQAWCKTTSCSSPIPSAMDCSK